jgi:uncharacterized membrane protein
MNRHVQVGGGIFKKLAVREFSSRTALRRVSSLHLCGLHGIEFLSFEFSYRKFNYLFENTQNSNFFVVIIQL